MLHDDIFTWCHRDMRFWRGWNIKNKKNHVQELSLYPFFFFLFYLLVSQHKEVKKKSFHFFFMRHQSSGTQKYTLIEEWPIHTCIHVHVCSQAYLCQCGPLSQQESPAWLLRGWPAVAAASWWPTWPLQCWWPEAARWPLSPRLAPPRHCPSRTSRRRIRRNRCSTEHRLRSGNTRKQHF